MIRSFFRTFFRALICWRYIPSSPQHNTTQHNTERSDTTSPKSIKKYKREMKKKIQQQRKLFLNSLIPFVPNITSFINELVPNFFSESRNETRLKWLHKRRTFASSNICFFLHRLLAVFLSFCFVSSLILLLLSALWSSPPVPAAPMMMTMMISFLHCAFLKT